MYPGRRIKLKPNAREPLTFQEKQEFPFFPEAPVRVTEAIEQDLSNLAFRLRIPHGSMLMADPLIEVEVDVLKEAVDSVKVQRMAAANALVAAAARDDIPVAYVPYPVKADDKIYAHADAFPIQSNCSEVRVDLQDKVLVDFPTETLNPWIQLNKTELMKRTTESSVCPFKSYYSNDDKNAPDRIFTTVELNALKNRFQIDPANGHVGAQHENNVFVDHPITIHSSQYIDTAAGAPQTFTRQDFVSYQIDTLPLSEKTNNKKFIDKETRKRTIVFDQAVNAVLGADHANNFGAEVGMAPGSYVGQDIPNSKATVVFCEPLCTNMWKPVINEKEGYWVGKSDVIVHCEDMLIRMTLAGNLADRLFSWKQFDNREMDSEEASVGINAAGGIPGAYVQGDGGNQTVLRIADVDNITLDPLQADGGAGFHDQNFYQRLRITGVRARIYYQVCSPTSRIPFEHEYFIPRMKHQSQIVEFAAGETEKEIEFELYAKQTPQVLFISTQFSYDGWTSNVPLDWNGRSGYISGVKIRHNYARESVAIWGDNSDRSSSLLHHTKRSFPLYDRSYPNHRNQHIVAFTAADLSMKDEIDSTRPLEIVPTVKVRTSNDFIAEQASDAPNENNVLAIKNRVKVTCVMVFNDRITTKL